MDNYEKELCGTRRRFFFYESGATSSIDSDDLVRAICAPYAKLKDKKQFSNLMRRYFTRLRTALLQCISLNPSTRTLAVKVWNRNMALIAYVSKKNPSSSESKALKSLVLQVVAPELSEPSYLYAWKASIKVTGSKWTPVFKVGITRQQVEAEAADYRGGTINWTLDEYEVVEGKGSRIREVVDQFDEEKIREVVILGVLGPSSADAMLAYEKLIAARIGARLPRSLVNSAKKDSIGKINGATEFYEATDEALEILCPLMKDTTLGWNLDPAFARAILGEEPDGEEDDGG